MPAASLTLTNVNTNTVRNGVTTDAGVYTFPSVPPGHYKVKAEVSGFKTWVSAPFEVQVQQTVRLDIALQVGQTSQTVEVSANAALLQSETASLGSVVENTTVTELPLNGRNYLNLVALAPNTNVLSPMSGQGGSRQGGDRAQQSIAVGGQRIFFDYYSLDGIYNSDPNFNTYVALPSIDAIQEFKVQTGVYPAEFGHQSTQVNVLTKSGGNNYHGALFEFLRNDAVDAKEYQFTSAKVGKNPFKWNDYGFELDGPVRIPHVFDGRDKLFFMSNYEAFRQRQTTQGIYSVPTAGMFGGDFSELLPNTVIYDPTTGQPFPNNVIPTNRLDPISLKFLNYYDSSTLPGLAQNFTQNNSSPVNRDEFVLRLDYNESPRSQWMGRYNWGDENQSTQGLGGAGQSILTNYEQYAGSNTRTFTPTLVNEARFGYTRLFNSVGTRSAFKKDVVSDLGIPGLNGGAPVTWGIPNMSFSGTGFSALGDVNDGPFAIDDNTAQFVDKLSWVHGNHTMDFGFEYDRQNFNQVGNQFSRGSFSAQANATTNPADGSGGYAFADFLLGYPFQSTVAVQVAQAKFQRNMFAMFADDTWKVTHKLTLSLGLRWELTPPFTDTLGNLFTVKMPKIQFGVAPAPVADTPVYARQAGCTDPYAGVNVRWPDITAVCGGGLGKNLMSTQYKNFAPRIGVAYALDDKTVIRSGFGIFYMQDIANAMYFDMARTLGARVTIESNTGTPTLTWSNAVPFGGGTLANVTLPYGYAAAPSHNTSYTMQYLLNVQRQFGNNWVVEAGYLGSESHHLYGFMDANQANPGATGNVVDRRPFPTWGTIQYVADGFNSNYNAGSLKVTRRFSQGVSLITSYTWSKSLDNSSGIRNQNNDQLFPQDSSCLRCEYARSAFDVRNRFVIGAVIDLPIGRGKLLDIHNPVGNAIAGGWQLSVNSTLQSGTPEDIRGAPFFNTSGTGSPTGTRPNFTGLSDGYLSHRSPAGWYDPAAFSLAPAGTFGNVGRNFLTSPAFQTLDMAIHKRFAMPYSEGHFLQFRLEAFNALNHPVWAEPNLAVASPDFGTITNTRIPMRQVQLGLKYLF
jgi:hypothetical protein